MIYAHRCTYPDYLGSLPDEALRDIYATRHGWNICPGDPYRYQIYYLGMWLRLASLPARQEMIDEIIAKETQSS